MLLCVWMLPSLAAMCRLVCEESVLLGVVGCLLLGAEAQFAELYWHLCNSHLLLPSCSSTG